VFPGCERRLYEATFTWQGTNFRPAKKFDRTPRFTGGHEIFSLCSRGILSGRRLNVRPVKVVFVLTEHLNA